MFLICGYPMFHANPLPISACLRLVVIRLKHILGEKKSTFSYAHPPHSMILMSSFISSCLSFSCLLWLSSLSQKFLNICVPGGSVVNLPANEWDAGSIPGLGRSPREGNGNPLQCSCLGNPWTQEPGGLQSMRSQESQTWLCD